MGGGQTICTDGREPNTVVQTPLPNIVESTKVVAPFHANDVSQVRNNGNRETCKIFQETS